MALRCLTGGALVKRRTAGRRERVLSAAEWSWFREKPAAGIVRAGKLRDRAGAIALPDRIMRRPLGLMFSFVTETPEASGLGCFRLRGKGQRAGAAATFAIAANFQTTSQICGSSVPSTRAKQAIRTRATPASRRAAMQALVVAPLVSTSSTSNTLAPRNRVAARRFTPIAPASTRARSSRPRPPSRGFDV